MNRLALRHAARDYGWLLAIIVSLATAVLVISVLRAAPEAAENIGIETGDTIKVTPREAGTNYDVRAFCNDPGTTVGKQPMTDAPEGGVRYIAQRGTESVNWPDSPPGKNVAATHYYYDAAGIQQADTGVEVTKDAAECLRGKAK